MAERAIQGTAQWAPRPIGHAQVTHKFTSRLTSQQVLYLCNTEKLKHFNKPLLVRLEIQLRISLRWVYSMSLLLFLKMYFYVILQDKWCSSCVKTVRLAIQMLTGVGNKTFQSVKNYKDFRTK